MTRPLLHALLRRHYSVTCLAYCLTARLVAMLDRLNMLTVLQHLDIFNARHALNDCYDTSSRYTTLLNPLPNASSILHHHLPDTTNASQTDTR
jgi:hypothetical protein